jgi:transcriptional regulator with GAF, ATPase, and Fis domain
MSAEPRFEILERAGSGSFAEVWKARDAKSGGLVALKIARDEGARHWLAREAAHASLALSPFLPELVDVGWLRVEGTSAWLSDECAPANGTCCIALRWVEGEPLASELRACTLASSRRDLALSVARDVGEALSDLHAVGQAHGDIKPENLLVDRQGRVHVIDLGLSSASQDKEIEGASPRYLARGDVDLGHARARDLIALGAVLAEIVDERVLADSAPINAARRALLVEPLQTICAALLAPQPTARPSAAWVADAASAALAGEGASASADVERMIERNVRQVRATYLRLRRSEITSAAATRGDSAAWLADAVAKNLRARSIAGQEGEGGVDVLGPMDAQQLARWLTALVGSSAASWPVAPLLRLGESAAADAMTVLARRIPPRVWTSLDLEHALSDGPRAVRHSAVTEPIRWGASLDPTRATELALALVRVPADPLAIEVVERTLDAPVVLLLAAVRALTLRGEYGRARNLVLRGIALGAPLVDPVAADVLRRAGDFELAAERARAAIERGVDPDGAARANLARMALEAGRVEEASNLVQGAEPSAAICEVQALVAVAEGDTRRAFADVARGEAFATTPEALARWAGMKAYVSHGHDPEAARHALSLAADHAVRAGAVVEEASYLTGLAGAAADCGDIALALSSSRRGALLGELLEKPSLVARARLAGAVANGTVGAHHDAVRLAEEAIEWARIASDVHAEIHAEWVIADASPRASREAVAAARRAAALASNAVPSVRLRAEARLLLHEEVSFSPARMREFDGVASDEGPASGGAKLEWWAARAADLSLRMSRGEESVAAEGNAAALILSRLAALSHARAEVGARGPALAAGVDLAARAGDGEMTRRLQSALSAEASEFLKRLPSELADAARMLPWVVRGAISKEPGIDPEQSRELESIVRSLSGREKLSDLLAHVVDSLVLWTGVERGLLLLRAPDGRLVPRAARNLERSDLRGEQLALSQTLALRALEQRQAIVATDASGDVESFHRSAVALKLRSVLAVPLIAGGEALGVVYLDDRIRRGAFGARELGWVRTIASLAAVAIADARAQALYRRAARRAERASRKLADVLAKREAELYVVERELAEVRGSRTRFPYDDLVGASEAMLSMLQIVDRVTATSVPVLVIGESGSGKELIVRAIHRNGPRGQGPFVSENCGAMPEGLLESALFGHVRGAFTGADRTRAGLFEIADGGTLFLDEIGEMSLPTQAKLLRVLEDGLVRPVGSERTRRVDVRIVAATHRDLTAMVRNRQFREDLFFRLNVIAIRVPPLRERSGDIPLIVRQMLRKHGGGKEFNVTRAAMARLSSYAWPGNVRQLENEVRRAIVLSDGTIDTELLSPEITPAGRTEVGLDLRSRVDMLEADLVRQALERTRGNQTQAAKILGLSRFGLQKMIARLGIRTGVRAEPD